MRLGVLKTVAASCPSCIEQLVHNRQTERISGSAGMLVLVYTLESLTLLFWLMCQGTDKNGRVSLECLQHTLEPHERPNCYQRYCRKRNDKLPCHSHFVSD